MKDFLASDPLISEPQKLFLIDSVSFILKNIFLNMLGPFIIKPKAQPVGKYMTPSYANLFMGIFKSKFIMFNNPFIAKIHIYKRYIDDLFILWEGNEKDANEFTDFLNQNPWGIKFTFNYGDD